MDYEYRTEPFDHQRSIFDATKDVDRWALFLEMGCGKSKITIDTFSYQWLKGDVDGVLVVAPEGVQVQWVDDEIPDHAPLQVLDSLDSFAWFTSKANSKSFQQRWKEFLNRPASKGLSVLTMTYHSLMTEKGAHAARAFLDSRRVHLVLDESTAIKTPGTQTTKRVLAMSKHAVACRVLNGTPISDSPFNAYTQMKVVDPTIWEQLGIKGAQAFRAYFGVYERRTNAGQGRQYDHLVAYRNLPDMAKIVQSKGHRLLKRDVFPNLPPKLYSRHYFDLAPKQRKAYQELKEEYRTWVRSGDLVTADIAIVRMTRLQQICSGYLPADDEEDLKPLVDPKENPRLKLLREIVEEIPGKFILWAKYNVDVDLIQQLLRSMDIPVVTWDGRTSEMDRRHAKAKFLDPDGARAFLGKSSSSAARGLNLQVASTVVYYNNSFVLDDRLQSEDRAHRPGIHHPVKYIDIIGSDTIDSHIVDCLRKKRDVAAEVTGDFLDAWL